MTAPTLNQQLAERMRPAGRVVMRQQWAHLLFLHWQWDPAEIQRTLPPGLTVDVHDGRAWLGVVPFHMNRVRPAGLPAVPWFSDFLELNLRTYVHDEQGRPGVWFYSLDCNRWLAVKIARTGFHLPYEHAGITAGEHAGTIDFRARRHGQATSGAEGDMFTAPRRRGGKWRPARWSFSCWSVTGCMRLTPAAAGCGADRWRTRRIACNRSVWSNGMPRCCGWRGLTPANADRTMFARRSRWTWTFTRCNGWPRAVERGAGADQVGTGRSGVAG